MRFLPSLPRRLRLLPALVLLAGLITSLAGIGLSHLLIEQSARGRLHDETRHVPIRRAGLVLGCAPTVAEGRTNLFFAYRIDAAARLYHAGRVDCLIVSGDNGRKSYDEPTAMAEALVRLGVPRDRIALDYAGFRTLDSIVRSRAIFGQDAITVVSQPFHNKRAIFIARSRGIDAIGFNARDLPRRASPRTFLREYLARVKTVLDTTLLRSQPKYLGPPVPLPTKSS